MLKKLFLRKFRQDDDGAITVDWVVLTASVIALAVAGFIGTLQGVNTAGSNVSTTLSTTKTQ